MAQTNHSIGISRYPLLVAIKALAFLFFQAFEAFFSFRRHCFRCLSAVLLAIITPGCLFYYPTMPGSDIGLRVAPGIVQCVHCTIPVPSGSSKSEKEIRVIKKIKFMKVIINY